MSRTPAHNQPAHVGPKGVRGRRDSAPVQLSLFGRGSSIDSSSHSGIQGIPDDAEPIPGYEGDYLITPDGEVWSRKWRGPRPMDAFDGRAGKQRVCLRRHDTRWRPNIETLLERTFGTAEENHGADEGLADYVLESYGDDEEVQRWAGQVFDAAS